MPKITDIFNVTNARSKGFETYSFGNTPFISNGFENNGVVGYVEPFGDDKVFNNLSICISAFCETTVQKPPFLPRGNGGSGLKVLTPKINMSYDELLAYAALINTYLKWRFSYGRMVNVQRLMEEEIIEPPKDISLNISSLKKFLKAIVTTNKLNNIVFNNINKFNITDIFTLKHGDFHSLDTLDSGHFPCVSRINSNNGIEGYYDLPTDAEVYPPLLLTVSTVTGDCFMQLDSFIATDNVVICKPKLPLKKETMFYISAIINKEKWRWMYGRQCYKTKFSTTSIYLPTDKKGKIDEDVISTIVKSAWGWKELSKYSSK